MIFNLFQYLNKFSTKTYFIYILLFYLGLHIIAPWAISPIIPLKEMEQGFYTIEELNIYKTITLHSIAILTSVLCIWLLPLKETSRQIQINEKLITRLYLILFTIALCRIFSPFLRHYITKLDVVLHFTHWRVYAETLFIWGNKELSIFVLFFLLVCTIIMKGSRTAPLYVFMLLCSVLILNPQKRKRIYYLLFICILLTLTIPWSFRFATQMRTTNQENTASQTSNLTSSLKNINQITKKSVDALDLTPLQLVVSRISNLERGGLAIYFKDHENDPKIKDKLALFYKLNEPLRQIKLFLNCFVIGSFFEEDELPNQYNIHIFIGRDIKEIKQRYVSWGVGLLPYLYLFFGSVGSVIVYIFVIVGLYLITLWGRNRSPLFFMSGIFYIYYVLDFFDITFHLTALLMITSSLFLGNITFYQDEKREFKLSTIFSMVKGYVLNKK